MRLGSLRFVLETVFFSVVASQTQDSSSICSAGQISCDGADRFGQRLAIVTGSNRGIGLEVVSGLLSRLPEDFDVLLTSRHESKGRAAIRCLKQRHYGEGVGATCCDGERAAQQPCEFGSWFYRDVGAGSMGDRLRLAQLDLADDGSVDAFVLEVKRTYRRVDVLVNNAAAPASANPRTHIRVDHSGHHRLVMGLSPLLATGARVVFVGSEAGSLRRFSPALQQQLLHPQLSWERLNALLENYIQLAEAGQQEAAGWPAGSGYAVAKAANGASTRILAREIAARAATIDLSNNTGKILVNACCPGPANAPHCQKGAHTILELALLPLGSVISGRWFVDRVWSGQLQEVSW